MREIMLRAAKMAGGSIRAVCEWWAFGGLAVGV